MALGVVLVLVVLAGVLSAWMGHEAPVGIVVIDLDDLKLLNDTAGHAAGDEALRRTANGISAAVRAGDLVARVGGDEFVVLLTDSGFTRAGQLADQVREAIGRIEMGAFGPLSVSTGVDICPGRDLLFGLNRADEMLYEAKRRRPRRHVARVDDPV